MREPDPLKSAYRVSADAMEFARNAGSKAEFTAMNRVMEGYRHGLTSADAPSLSVSREFWLAGFNAARRLVEQG